MTPSLAFTSSAALVDRSPLAEVFGDLAPPLDAFGRPRSCDEAGCWAQLLRCLELGICQWYNYIQYISIYIYRYPLLLLGIAVSALKHGSHAEQKTPLRLQRHRCAWPARRISENHGGKKPGHHDETYPLPGSSSSWCLV